MLKRCLGLSLLVVFGAGCEQAKRKSENKDETPTPTPAPDLRPVRPDDVANAISDGNAVLDLWSAAYSQGDEARFSEFYHLDPRVFRADHRDARGATKRFDRGPWLNRQATEMKAADRKLAAESRQWRTWLDDPGLAEGSMLVRFVERRRSGKLAEHGMKELALVWQPSGRFKIVWERKLTAHPGWKAPDRSLSLAARQFTENPSEVMNEPYGDLDLRAVARYGECDDAVWAIGNLSDSSVAKEFASRPQSNDPREFARRLCIAASLGERALLRDYWPKGKVLKARLIDECRTGPREIKEYDISDSADNFPGAHPNGYECVGDPFEDEYMTCEIRVSINRWLFFSIRAVGDAAQLELVDVEKTIDSCFECGETDEGRD